MKEVDGMKHNRRVLSLLLAICLVVSVIPAVVFADTAYVPGDIKDEAVVAFAGMDWLVMSNNSKEMVLLLKDAMDPIAYTASGLSNDWESSDAKKWCENFANSLPLAERNAISDVYFLSYSEAATYFANKSMNSLKTKNGWWLRYDEENDSVSPGSDVFGFAVSDAGLIGMPHVATNYGARPAIKIPVSNITSVDSVNGKWVLKVVDAYTFANTKITIPTIEAKPGEEINVTISYKNAIVGSELNVFLTDRVGNIVQTFEPNVVNGSVGTFDVPLGNELMGWHSLCAYFENGNYTSSVVKSSFNVEDSHGEVVGHGATVKGDVTINFDIDIKENIIDETGEIVDAGAVVRVTTPSNSYEVPVADLGEASDTGVALGANKALLVSVKAPQMTDTITIQVGIKDDNGNIVSAGAEQSFTVREYGEAVISQSDAIIEDIKASEEAKEEAQATKTLVEQMLNYGSTAQVYFNTNAKDLADKNVDKKSVSDFQQGVPDHTKPNDYFANGTEDEDYKKLFAKKLTDIDGIIFYGATLVMNAQVSLRFYFEIDEARYSIGNFDFSQHKGHTGRAKVNGKMYYFVEIPNIAPDKLYDEFSMVVNGEEWVSYSPMAYIVRQHNATNNGKLGNMLHSLYNYYRAAVIYAEKIAG